MTVAMATKTTHSSLVELHLLVSEVWHLFERVDRDQHWADVGL